MKINEKAKKLLLGYREIKEYHENGQISAHYFCDENNSMYGERRRWYKNGCLYVHCWHYHNVVEGEYKIWDNTGILLDHCWFVRGEKTEIPKDVKLKEGYILASDGKYYEDK